MSDDPRVGTLFGRYRIERVLGRGGMGTVYVADDTNPHLPRRVALKVLNPELAADPTFRERFASESLRAIELDHHSSIVPVYDAGEHEGTLFIAMRYVDGTDLRSVLEERGALAPRQVASIVGQIADALDVAHRGGLVHRDVKPANILLSNDETHAYLADFGLTKRLSAESGLSYAGQFLGTFHYAAPEQLEGKPVDGRTDQYALGCVLYESLTGSPPFTGETQTVIAGHLAGGRPRVTAARPGLAPEIDAVVARAMAKDPADRFPTSGEMAAAAADAAARDRGTVITGPQPALPPTREPGRRQSRSTVPAPLIVAGAFGLVVVLGVVAFLLFGRGGGGGGDDPPDPPPDAGTLAAVEQGDCWDGDLLEEESEPIEDIAIDLIPCDEPHDFETYAVVEHPDSEFPGDRELDDFSQEECVDAFEPFVGTDVGSSELQTLRVWPEEQDWDDGEREISCSVSDGDGGKLEGSVEDSAR